MVTQGRPTSSATSVTRLVAGRISLLPGRLLEKEGRLLREVMREVVGAVLAVGYLGISLQASKTRIIDR